MSQTVEEVFPVFIVIEDASSGDTANEKTDEAVPFRKS